MLDPGYWILDVGQIVDDLAQISRQDWGALIADARYSSVAFQYSC